MYERAHLSSCKCRLVTSLAAGHYPTLEACDHPSGTLASVWSIKCYRISEQQKYHPLSTGKIFYPRFASSKAPVTRPILG